MSSSMRGNRWLAAVAAIGMALAWHAVAAEPVAPAGADAVVLDAGGSFIRWMSVQRPAVLVAEAGAAEQTSLDGKKKLDAKTSGQVQPGLPAGWTDAAFDDSLTAFSPSGVAGTGASGADRWKTRSRNIHIPFAFRLRVATTCRGPRRGRLRRRNAEAYA